MVIPKISWCFVWPLRGAGSYPPHVRDLLVNHISYTTSYKRGKQVLVVRAITVLGTGQKWWPGAARATCPVPSLFLAHCCSIGTLCEVSPWCGCLLVARKEAFWTPVMGSGCGSLLWGSTAAFCPCGFLLMRLVLCKAVSWCSQKIYAPSLFET